jgi:isopenicillin N synthase-like dioxygenase
MSEPSLAVPVIDLGPALNGTPAASAERANANRASAERASRVGRDDPIVAAIARACEEVGFFVATGHGVPDELARRVRSAAAAFFALPEAVKQGARHETGMGFSPVRAEALAASLDKVTAPDLKESYTIGRPDGGTALFPPPAWQPNIWTAESAELRAAVEPWYAAMTRLATSVLDLFARALDIAADILRAGEQRHRSVARVIHYPPDDHAEPGQLRAGEHTDYGTFTLVQPDGPGLEIFHNGQWQAVPLVPDGYVVNLGDVMARWTNDRWASTLHRVYAQEHPDRPVSSRMSLVYFHGPDPNLRIDTLPSYVRPGERSRYRPVTAGGHSASKISRQIQAGGAGPAPGGKSGR